MSTSDGGLRPGILAALLIPFALLATLNSAGYRYGASDQAFYVPAALKSANPALYPRDGALIQSQAKLTIIDEVMGQLSRAGVPLPAAFAALQVTTLALLALAAIRLANSFYRTRWAVIAFLAALTLRHAIIQSGTNTLEGYFHPRQLAFAIAALGLGSFMRGRYAAMWTLIVVAGAVHPTTALWFAVWVGAASFVAEPRLRMPLAVLVGIGTLSAGWALTLGPLAGRFVTMDDEWLATLADKGYLFPLAWPLAAWLVNLAYIPLIAGLYAYRRRCGLLAPREPALVAGCLTLVVIFLSTLPFNAARVAFAIQLQPARVFWMLDLLAVIYVVWVAAEGGSRAVPMSRRAAIAALTIVMLSTMRGVYIKTVEFPGRRVAQIDLQDNDWGRVMAWARASPVTSGWLADPEHAVRYGTSLRVAGERDVCVEAIKDRAIGMYDRGMAMRTRERVTAVGDFQTLTPERARALAQQYDLTYLVTEQALALPVAFSSGDLRVYALR
jgi:hypothetical protein